MFFYDIIWCYYIQPLRLTNFDSFEQQNTLKSASAWEDSCGFRRRFVDLNEVIKDVKAKSFKRLCCVDEKLWNW